MVSIRARRAESRARSVTQSVQAAASPVTLSGAPSSTVSTKARIKGRWTLAATARSSAPPGWMRRGPLSGLHSISPWCLRYEIRHGLPRSANVHPPGRGPGSGSRSSPWHCLPRRWSRPRLTDERSPPPVPQTSNSRRQCDVRRRHRADRLPPGAGPTARRDVRPSQGCRCGEVAQASTGWPMMPWVSSSRTRWSLG